ncbi:glycosyltransferase [Niabella ginsengisoli]|uniref:Glycosyltransferase family 4 protein n=1 Tax=Niabella ginsengisoli TaxID=522298 RepID=A0ABS9SK38_9BACT|nr:glycosyltransferase [Niabella ginsengisoli]MCH5598733.1 glycosyltransferase family 4 protein [Niabella ginsengisoli]
MKLLFVHDHPFFPDDQEVFSGGGLPSNVWNNYLNNFSRIDVYARKSCNSKNRKVISSNTNVNFHLTDKYNSIKELILNYKLLVYELQQIIKDTDLVLVRLPSILGFIAGNLAFKMNKKIWVEQVGSAKESMSTHGSLLGKISAPIAETINKKLIKKADFVTYVTQKQLQLKYPAHHNALTASISNVIIKKVIQVQDLDLSRFYEKKLKICLIGGFDVKYKGQGILLKAIKILDKDIQQNIEIYLAGKGEYNWILNIAEDCGLINNIKFIGQLSAGDAINSLLKKTSLYVQPSLTEGLPRATIEAMSMGCPVLASNVGGLPDIICNDYIHPKGDFKKLSGQIRELFSDRSALENMAKKISK